MPLWEALIESLSLTHTTLMDTHSHTAGNEVYERISERGASV